MKNKLVRRILSVGVVATMAVGMLAGCGSKKSADGPDSFTWWINQTDGQGQYYETYEQNPVAQWVGAQYWDSENGGIGTEETGKQLNISYIAPVTGSEMDTFSTMMSTGDYPEVLDSVYSTDTVQTLYANGTALDITEYVEKYMPNYRAFLDANPELKPQVTIEEDGKTKYIAIYPILDGEEDPWQGYIYRRDWVVKYAKPTEYVWDWDSEQVQANGHPEVTPLEKAVSSGNLNGWKKNDVTAFKADYGKDPDNDYTDNVIFPSGKTDPYTISDWEWMFAAFAQAIDERGWKDDSTAYCTTVQRYGFDQMGSLVSSFGGGTGSFYVNRDGVAEYDGTSENFKTYIDCVQNWNEQGWLDKSFAERGELFYMINTEGVNQGKTGMWVGLSSNLGTAIRVTCADETDKEDAFAMACALPINDVYGGDAQKFKEPDSKFVISPKGTPIVITDKAKDKDIPTLLTFIDWAYTREGALTIRFGLNEEQLASMKFNPDVYAENDVTAAYTVDKDDEGKTLYKRVPDPAGTLRAPLCGQRMDVGIKLSGNGDDLDYSIDLGNTKVVDDAIDLWLEYRNTGYPSVYTSIMETADNEVYSKRNTALTDYQAMNLPNVIKGDMSWEAYVQGIEELKPDEVVPMLQKCVDKLNGK